MPLNANHLTDSFFGRFNDRYEFLAPNVYPCWRFGEMDIMAVRKSGYIDEIEIKLSKADFKADFRKFVTIKLDEEYFDPKKSHVVHSESRKKHECLAEGLNHCNRFSFLVTEELAEQIKDDIPEYAGLYVWNGKWVEEVKKAPLLHRRKISDRMKYEITKKLAWRYWEGRRQYNDRINL